MDNKKIFASNLKKYMKLKGKTRREVCGAIGVSYFTFTDWVNGKTYPRMDKVELLARYFGILKSDLIEEKPNSHIEMIKKNDTLADIVLLLREDGELFAMVEKLCGLDVEQRTAVKLVLNALSKADK